MSGVEATRKRPLEGEEGQSIRAAAGSQSGQQSNEDNGGNPPPLKMARVQNSNIPDTTATPATISQNTQGVALPPIGASSAPINRAQRPQLPEQHARSVQGQHPGPAHPSQQPQRSSRLEHAFFGMEVMDDVVHTVGDFLLQYCNLPNVEIEAKLGVILDYNTGQRLELPVKNEVVLSQNSGLRYRFVSDMTLERQIQYRHTYEVDQFFPGPGGKGKVRVTKDQKTNKVIENGIVRKDRIANLDVLSPRNAFDFRVSVNAEVPVPAPSGTAQFERNKDRLSYRLNNLKIDLTQVKSGNTPGGSGQAHNFNQMRPSNSNQQDLTHELEIEFVHPEELVRERDIRINGGGHRPDRFYEIVGRFVNNIRGLMAQGNPPSTQQQQQQQRYSQQRPS
ncbi:mRNA-capping enzyme subunit beta [Mortierella sp. AM989]|nr:mRNA-capping enzyme subunit beta [Mortierella sp. AM989]